MAVNKSAKRLYAAEECDYVLAKLPDSHSARNQQCLALHSFVQISFAATHTKNVRELQ